MNLGKAIRTARAARALSQKELAALAELNPSYISLLESEQRIPSTATLEVLARVLDIPIYLLMLLGSERDDLRGLSPKEAQVLGNQLLNILTNLDSKPAD